MSMLMSSELAHDATEPPDETGNEFQALFPQIMCVSCDPLVHSLTLISLDANPLPHILPVPHSIQI